VTVAKLGLDSFLPHPFHFNINYRQAQCQDHFKNNPEGKKPRFEITRTRKKTEI
jgi:hypothetical protein